MTTGIFICYRREDTSGHAGRLRDALSARFSQHEIFRDFEAVGPGDDFVRAMSRAIGSCTVFLAVIGKQWLTVAGPDGTRRLDDPEDHVRREIAEALDRDVRVIPVLVQGAMMPRARDLPDQLKPLATRNAITLDDEGWDSDVERLAAAIRPQLRSGTDVDEQRAAPARPRQEPKSRLGTRQQLLAALAVAASLTVTTVIVRNWPETPRPDQRDARATAPRIPTGNAIPTGRERSASLPMGGEAELGEAVYEILEARVVANKDGFALTLRIRLMNHGRYDAGLSDGAFRLLLNEGPIAPTNSLGELVPAETAKEGTLTFDLPLQIAAAATLRIRHANETADIPLDLSGRNGPTPAQDRDARRAGRTTLPVSIDPATATLRFGDLSYELRSATVRRYAHKLTLSLSVRARNRGRYDANFGDSQFRAVLAETARAPVGGLNELVAGDGTRDGDVLFDLPLEARQVILRVRVGETIAEVPLQLPSR